MTSKTSIWTLLGPAVWIAILVLVASGKADGTVEPVSLPEIALEKNSSVSTIGCVHVVRSEGENLGAVIDLRSTDDARGGPA